jgi:hypothetical protein
MSLAIMICATATFVAGCGTGAQRHAAQQIENVSVVSNAAPLSERLVTQSEIASASNTAAVGSFLKLWSLLQFQSWDQAEQLFEPGLRSVIGASVLAQALAADVIVWEAARPKIVAANATATSAVITFLARGETGVVMPSSISFERIGGSWLISYFSLLDAAIQRSVQARAQAEIEPLATKPSPEAVRQGFNALVLQSTYLERHAPDRPIEAGRAGTKP